MKFAVPLIVTVGLCYVLFKGLDFNEMIAIISEQCDFRWIALALVLALALSAAGGPFSGVLQPRQRCPPLGDYRGYDLYLY